MQRHVKHEHGSDKTLSVLQLTASQSCCDTRPCPTMSLGLMGTSWSAAFVVGVTTISLSLRCTTRL